MKLRATVTRYEAVEEIRRFLELEGYIVHIRAEQGRYAIYTDIPEPKSQPQKKSKKTTGPAAPQPMLTPSDELLVKLLILLIITLLFIKFIIK